MSVALVGALTGTGLGFATSVVVANFFSAAEVSAFFLIASLGVVGGTMADFGLANHVSYDIGGQDGVEKQRKLASAVVLAGLRRGMVALALVALVAVLVFGMELSDAAGAGLVALSTTILVGTQAILRGLGRDVPASFGGTILPTILLAAVVAGVVLVGRRSDLTLPVVSSYLAAAALALGLTPRSGEGRTRLPETLRLARTAPMAMYNVLNAASRQADLWLAALLLSDGGFASYAITTRIAAALGLITSASKQSLVPSIGGFVEHNRRDVRRVRKTTIAALLFLVVGSVTVGVLGPSVAGLVFRGQIDPDFGVFWILAGGYFAAAWAGPASASLVQQDRSSSVLRNGAVSGLVAVVAAVVVLIVFGPRVAVPTLAAVWIALAEILCARSCRKGLGLRTVWYAIDRRIRGRRRSRARCRSRSCSKHLRWQKVAGPRSE